MGCPICLDSFGDTPSARPVAIRCGHLFHSACLSQWLVSQSTTSSRNECPSCKSKTTQADAVALFPSDAADLERWKEGVAERAAKALERLAKGRREKKKRDEVRRGKRRLIEDDDDDEDEEARHPHDETEDNIDEEEWLDILVDFERSLQAYVMAASHGRRMETARKGARTVFRVIKGLGDEEDAEERDRISALKQAIEALHDVQVQMASRDRRLEAAREAYESRVSKLDKERSEVESLRRSVEEENQKAQGRVEAVAAREKEVGRERLRQIKARGLMEREAGKAKHEAEVMMERARELMAAANKSRLEVTHTIAVREAEMKAEVEAAVRAKEEAIGRQHEAEKERDVAVRKSNALADQMRLIKGQAEQSKKAREREREKRKDAEARLREIERLREEEERRRLAQPELKRSREEETTTTTTTPARSRPGIDLAQTSTDRGMPTSSKRPRATLGDRTNTGGSGGGGGDGIVDLTTPLKDSSRAHWMRSSSPIAPSLDHQEAHLRLSSPRSQSQDLSSHSYEPDAEGSSISRFGMTLEMLGGAPSRKSKESKARAIGGFEMMADKTDLDDEMDDQDFPMPGMARISPVKGGGALPSSLLHGRKGGSARGAAAEEGQRSFRTAPGKRMKRFDSWPVASSSSSSSSSKTMTMHHHPLRPSSSSSSSKFGLPSSKARTAPPPQPLKSGVEAVAHPQRRSVPGLGSRKNGGLAAFGFSSSFASTSSSSSVGASSSNLPCRQSGAGGGATGGSEKDSDSIERRLLDSAKRLVVGPKRRVQA